MPRKRRKKRKRLELRRRIGESVRIGEGIVVQVVRVTPNGVQLGIDAPGLAVVRPEVGV